MNTNLDTHTHTCGDQPIDELLFYSSRSSVVHHQLTDPGGRKVVCGRTREQCSLLSIINKMLVFSGKRFSKRSQNSEDFVKVTKETLLFVRHCTLVGTEMDFLGF